MKNVYPIGHDVYRAYHVLMQRYWNFVADGEIGDFTDIQDDLDVKICSLINEGVEYLYHLRKDALREREPK